ncbi:MAG: hypothetical protein IAG10_34315, partial [Planctomycetaceae bacterium]|nr:hypothetical protein [Planctomycetaceae bacterium]
MTEDELLMGIAVVFLAWVAVFLTTFFATAEALAFTQQTNRKAARTVGTIAIVQAGLALCVMAFSVTL